MLIFCNRKRTKLTFFLVKYAISKILIWERLRLEEALKGGNSEVFTGRDNGERRTFSLHSPVSLDVTFHLFITSLTCISKMRVAEWKGEARTWSWAYRVSPNIERLNEVVRIRMIDCCVE